MTQLLFVDDTLLTLLRILSNRPQVPRSSTERILVCRVRAASVTRV